MLNRRMTWHLEINGRGFAFGKMIGLDLNILASQVKMASKGLTARDWS